MIRPLSLAAALCAVLSVLALTGCKKPQIRVYTVAKDAPFVPATAENKPASEAPRRAKPQLDYQLPTGWQEAGPSEFSLLNFRIPTAAGEAMVNITPLAGMAGRDTAIVNMWRAQLGQPELDEPAAAAALTPVEVAGESGRLFEVTGTRDGQTQRIVTAFVHRADGSWFYKLQGADAAVTAQKPAFIAFLKSVKIKEGPAVAATPAAPSSEPPEPPEPPPTPAMMAPEGWQTLPPGQMQVAKFGVNKDGAKAEVSVSVFPSDTGGTLSNVNRWRRQLGLAETDEAGLAECVTPLEGAAIDGAPGAMLADLSHENRRMLGAIVPREGRWWFYKMMGDAAVVDAERESFLHFVKSQP
jgi:hypothetical protein